MDKVAWAGQMEQDSKDRIGVTGQTGQERTSWAGHLRPHWERTLRQVGLDKTA